MRKKTSRVESRSGADALPVFRSGEEFDTISASDEEKVWNYYDRLIPESELCDPGATEKAILAVRRRRHRKAGRPRVGEGAKMVAVTIERGLLKKADAFAKKHGLKRAEMVALGLQNVMKAASK